MRLYKNNSGVTLVELIISIAIAAIVLSMIALMINAAANSFKRTNEDVDLQMEAQIVMNQLSTYIMEASDLEKINDIIQVADSDAKYVIRYGSGAGATYKIVYFIKDKKRLYLILVNNYPELVVEETVTGDEDEYLLAENVTDFKIAFDINDIKYVKVEIDFGLGHRTYTAEKNIKLRNVK